jgi:transposase-like protein
VIHQGDQPDEVRHGCADPPIPPRADFRYYGADTPSNDIKGLRFAFALPGGVEDAILFLGILSMAQHFLLSAAARTFSLAALCQLPEETAYKIFCRMRWPETDGSPVCPKCSCPVAYVYHCRRLFKCKGCHRQFSVTSGTLFASRKLSFQLLLLAIGLLVNAAINGVAAFDRNGWPPSLGIGGRFASDSAHSDPKI